MAKKNKLGYDDWADYIWLPDVKKRIFPIPLNWPAGGIGEDNPLQKLIDDMKEVDDEAIEMSDKEEDDYIYGELDDYIYEELEEDDDKLLRPVLEEIELDDGEVGHKWVFPEVTINVDEDDGWGDFDKMMEGFQMMLEGADEEEDEDEEELSSVELKTIRDEDDLATDGFTEWDFSCILCDVELPTEDGLIPGNFADWFCELCNKKIDEYGENEEES